MRKINKLIIMLLLLLVYMVPISIKADCGMSGPIDIDLKVINKNGAFTYEDQVDKVVKTNEKIPYDTVVKLYYDFKKENGIYYIDVIYNGKNLLVNAADFENVDKITKDNLVKSDYYTYKNVEVREAPGFSSKVVGTIKKDTRLYVEKKLIKQQIDKSWIYVSDGKVSGYVYSETCTSIENLEFGTKAKGTYYYIGPDNRFLDIKSGDKIDVKYWIPSIHSAKGYVEKEGKSVIIDDYFIAKESNSKMILLPGALEGENSITVYLPATYDLHGENKSINAKNILKYDKVYDVIAVMNSDNNTGVYLKIDGKYYILNEWAYSDSSLIIYDSIDKVKPSSDYYYYSNNETKYFFDGNTEIEIYLLNKDYHGDSYYSKEYGFIYRQRSLENEITTTSVEKEKNEIIIENNKSLSSRQVVTYCLFGAILLTAISIIIIKLINKKNKTNKSVKNEKETDELANKINQFDKINGEQLEEKNISVKTGEDNKEKRTKIK